MLIRLIPSASQPTVLFKLVFENFPDHAIQTPLAWVNLLTALDSDDLEIPELMHALDKAVGVQSILDQVSFDLVDQKIRCVFVDGEMEEWDIASVYHGLVDQVAYQRKVDLVRRLDSVIDDVNESAAEMDKIRKREEEQQQLQRLKEEEKRLEAAKQKESAVQSESTTRKNRPGHKKQRSLLMNLVSALIPLSLNSPRSPRSPRSSPSSSVATPRSTSPASSIRSERLPAHTTSAPSTLSRSATLPNPGTSRPVSVSSLSSPYPTTTGSTLSSPTEVPVVIVAPPGPPPLSPRGLRRRARSTLVDAFRLYVLPELNRRIRSNHIANSPGSNTVSLYGSDISAPYYFWVVASTLKQIDSRLSEIGKELRDEMDAIGVEMNTLPLATLGLRSVSSLSESGPTPSPSGDSSVEDGSSRSEAEEEIIDEAAAESNDVDSMSDATLVDSANSSLFSIPDIEDSSAVHYHQPKPSLVSLYRTPPATAFPPSKYLKSSSCSEIPTPAPIAHPEVPLPENLGELLIQHNELSSVHLRLAHLLLASHARAAAAAAETAQRETILEVRGRRRAWLNRTLAPDNSVEPTKVHSWSGAMGSPFRSSGLAKYSFSSEEWECDPYHYLDVPRSPLSTLVTDVYPNPFDSESDTNYAAYIYSHRRRRSASDTTVSLFPVFEEESVDGFDDGPRRHLDIEIDEGEEDDEEDGDDTDVDPLVDIELDDVLRKPNRPFLQIDTFDSTTVLKSPNPTSSTSLSVRLDVNIPKDPFDAPEDDLRAPSALLAATNISKRRQ